MIRVWIQGRGRSECGGVGRFGIGELWVVMKIISWNIRGLGGVEKRPEVRKLVSEKNPSIVCL
jgi:hypothetical protein